jgi:hypothetical protein
MQRIDWVNILSYLCIIVAVVVALSLDNKKEGFHRGLWRSPPAYHADVHQFFRDPVLSDGDKFMLKTLDGLYVSTCQKCSPVDANMKNLCSSLLCLTRFPLKSSVFTFHSFRDGRFAVETFDYRFWKHCDNCVHECRGAVCGDGINKKLRTHKFHLIKQPDRTVTIRTNSGRMIQRCNCSQTCGYILCTMGLNDRETERFVVEKIQPGPVEPKILRFKPKRGRSSLFDGVSLSMVQ